MMQITLQSTIFTFSWLGLLVTAAHGHQAEWMSGKHGIGFRIPGGVNMETAIYDVDLLINQIKDNIPEIRWVLLGLSSGSAGDRYLSSHSILTNLNRGSTPRQTQDINDLPDWYKIGGSDFEIEKYPEREVFAEIANALHENGFKVIAYMAAQGPTFLKHGETKAYDYNNSSLYVNSVTECDALTNGTILDGTCAPSVRKWKNHVKDIYGDDNDLILQKAYAELIVNEYANKFDGKDGNALIDGWWFDQGSYMNISLVHEIIMKANPDAVIAFNKGQKVPLRNNNPPYEHYTFGHPTPIKNTKPYDMVNLPMITSIEDTSDGFFKSGESYSLGHVFQMTNTAWNHGNLVWNDDNRLPQAIDWMSRVINAKGAWTWNVKRTHNPTQIHVDDIALLKQIYAELSTPSPTTSYPTTLNPTSSPTNDPTTNNPTTNNPTTHNPTPTPTNLPTTNHPTTSPTHNPTTNPTTKPTLVRDFSPTPSPTKAPTESPTTSISPTKSPSKSPTTSNAICSSVGVYKYLKAEHCKGRANKKKKKFARHWKILPGKKHDVLNTVCNTDPCKKKDCCEFGPQRKCNNTGLKGLVKGGFIKKMCGKKMEIEGKSSFE